MRKLSKKISMLMVLAMLVGLFSGVVSASAASAWSFASSKYDVAVNGSINMESKEYADFDLLKDGKAPAGYTVAWASSDEDVVWVNAKTGQLRANKFGKAADGDKAVISATFTNTATKKSATRSFTIVLGAAKADFTVEADDVTIALGEEVKFAPVVKNAAGNTVKFATHKSYNGYFLDGKAIANPWTPEEAGEYTVTVAQFAKKANVADLAKAVRKTEVKVTVTVDADFDAKATGLKEITVYGDFAKDATFAVKKDGKQNISFKATVAEDGKSAVLALQNKLYEGIYTVTYGDAKVELAIEDEKVASIIIFEKDSQIFTNAAKTVAYAHYDVLNQYGESVRKSYDVTWNSSAAGGISADTTNGILTIVKAASGATTNLTFNYNDPVVLTGVASGYGYAVSETASMTIGLEDSGSTVKVIGVIKKDTTKILNEVPASFAGGTYQLVFEMYNRAGYSMDFVAATAADDFTFTSLNPLLVKEVKAGRAADTTVNVKTIYIDGKAYGAVDLIPGNIDQVKAGGVAEIRIVSTKTGVTSTYNLRVVSEQILVDFKVLQPSDIIPKNSVYGGASDIELKFEATDKEGAAITDFRALYKAVSFSTSDVQLREQNDGTAKLFYTVPASVTPTKEHDYPVVFTAIVPGSGATDNVKFSVKNNRIASSPMQYNGAVEVLEGDSLKLFLRDDANQTWNRDGGIDWADQYDSKIMTNGLFADRYVGVKVLGGQTGISFSAGTCGTTNYSVYPNVNTDVANNYVTTTADGYMLFNPNLNAPNGMNFNNLGAIYLNAANAVTEDVKEFAVEFILYDSTKNEFVGGSDIVLTFKVVDLSQCVGYEAGVDDNYVKNNQKFVAYSVKGVLSNGNKVEIPNNIAGAVTGNAVVSYRTEVSGVVLAASGSNLGTQVWGEALNTTTPYHYSNFDLTEATGNAYLFKDKSKFNADGTYADRPVKVDVIATISAVYGAGTTFKDSVNTSYEVVDHDVYWTSINTKGWIDWWFSWTNGNTAATIQANAGILTFEDLIACIDNKTDSLKDVSYGTGNSGVSVTITKLCEGTRGLRVGDIMLLGNSYDDTDKVLNTETDDPTDTWTPMIGGLEIGDTFTVTYKIGGASHVVNYTVGADRTAKFSNSNDNLTWR